MMMVPFGSIHDREAALGCSFEYRRTAVKSNYIENEEMNGYGKL